jgi:preprotein translocase subunit SecD
MNVRENWRIVLLAVFVVASTVALFAPGGAGAAGNNTTATQEGPTNLQYGLELSGGTRVRAPLVGMTAADVSVSSDQEAQVTSALVDELDVNLTDIQIRRRGQGQVDVELFVSEDQVSQQEFAAALQSGGVDVTAADVRDGVTQQTRETAVRVINRKINLGGLSGGQAQIVTTATGENFVLVEVPNENRSDVISLLDERGTVQLVATYPVQRNNTTVSEREPVIGQDDIASIQPATTECGGAPACVPVTVSTSGNPSPAERYAQTMRETGFTSEQGIQNCNYRSNPEEPGYCLLTVTDGRVSYSASMGRDLARGMESGDFEKTGEFVITSNNLSEAQRLALDLRAGALPTTLAIQEEGTTFFLEPSLAGRFKALSLLTGLVAALAVAVTVFIRYGRPEVAAPMFVTAISEVYLLLGFASLVGLALDLSHIAGFIAVIGTGVDDLVIIADEILQRGEIRTAKVFQSRFRKAFWVIGAAAATTIIAMSPLAVLSLGDLQGFAIITIVGVLLGVLVTRPAYGDVLRNLILGRESE